MILEFGDEKHVSYTEVVGYEEVGLIGKKSREEEELEMLRIIMEIIHMEILRLTRIFVDLVWERRALTTGLVCLWALHWKDEPL